MDKLIKSANVWNNLNNCCFCITYSLKGKLRKVPIVFDSSDFFHLAGFQYANDINLYKSSKNNIIDCVLQNKITLDQLKKAKTMRV